jgi:hypothetical protein
MEWYNEPPSWHEDGDRIVVRAGPETDCWRVTLHDFVADDAHFYHRTVEGDFTATVEVTGAYESQYDQAGLMVRDCEERWLNCGIEYVDGIQHASAVVTREFSDWSVVPLDDDPESVWIRVERTGPAVEVFFSRDGREFTMIRQAYLTETETLRVGPMAAAPRGDGFETIFENFDVE